MSSAWRDLSDLFFQGQMVDWRKNVSEAHRMFNAKRPWLSSIQATLGLIILSIQLVTYTGLKLVQKEQSLPAFKSRNMGTITSHHTDRKECWAQTHTHSCNNNAGKGKCWNIWLWTVWRPGDLSCMHVTALHIHTERWFIKFCTSSSEVETVTSLFVIGR
jgi:hypothetical protein